MDSILGWVSPLPVLPGEKPQFLIQSLYYLCSLSRDSPSLWAALWGLVRCVTLRLKK